MTYLAILLADIPPPEPEPGMESYGSILLLGGLAVVVVIAMVLLLRRRGG